MSDVMRDLWPEDIQAEVVISPEEILNFQAARLPERTGGRVTAHVVKRTDEDRVVIAFEVEARRAESRVRLFEVQHRLDFEYPAAIVPPDVPLPDFLKERVYRPGGLGSIGEVTRPGESVKNPWVASSPTEFSEKVEELLARPSVKGVVLSLLSRSNQQRRASSG